MALTVNWRVLRDLAEFRATEGIALSFYLDLDPAADVSTRVNSLLARAAREVDGGLTRDQQLSLVGDLDRVGRFVAEELDRGGARGLAVFASGLDNLWRSLLLSEPVADAVKVDAEILLTPLVPLIGRGEGALVAAVGRERGEVFRLLGGRLHPVADRTEEQPRRHDQGGWSQARLQRHVDRLAQEHLQRVAEELARRVRRDSERIVVVATEETRSAFTDLLAPDVLGSIVGWTTAEAHAGPAELLTAAAPVLDEWRGVEELRAIERWREEAGRNGRAAAGWEPTLEAASEGRVSLLLYREGADHGAWRCPHCGRATVHEEGVCPLDGTSMEPSDGLDVAVHRTLSGGGDVRALTERPDLDPVEGIGALLRY
jgi:peptide chain release factor subunit 1